MAYSELIKDFRRIRRYLRSFYVYGFRHREEYTEKSARSYDNERRRIESWLGDCLRFAQDADGRRVFLSVDSRTIRENPLYRAFRTKSFTERDILLHFLLLDLLAETDGLPIRGVMNGLVSRLASFDSAELPDESTVRKKLREYVSLGLLRTEKRGRETYYLRTQCGIELQSWDAALAFFSEAAPVGVIGSFVQDRLARRFDGFRFKHHYILNALDSEPVYALLCAIGERQPVSFSLRRRSVTVLPCKLWFGTQSGRQYLLGWSPKSERFSFYRVDLMDQVKRGAPFAIPEDLDARLAAFCAHIWGAANGGRDVYARIEMTVLVRPDEDFVARRLEREKRCGEVVQLDETHWRFSAEVDSPEELLPWLRTFLGRITALSCSDPQVTERFREDVAALRELYGGNCHDIS